jgi:hypothetical protein
MSLLVAGLILWTYPASEAQTRTAATRTYLDRQTGATITTMERPFVFARERPSLAVNARDYISLVAVEVNLAGERHLYWYGYIWTTIDDGSALATMAHEAEWLLLADVRPVALHDAGAMPRALGIATPPLSAPVRHATAVVFHADADVLDYVAGAGSLSVHAADSAEFPLWRDARDELAAFLGRLSR